MEQIIRETQETFFLYLVNVKNACLTLSENLRTDRIGEALNTITQFVEGASWIINVVTLMHQNGYGFNVSVEELNEFLQEINDGLEIQDYVLVADLFEYEIAPFIEKMVAGEFTELNK